MVTSGNFSWIRLRNLVNKRKVLHVTTVKYLYCTLQLPHLVPLMGGTKLGVLGPRRMSALTHTGLLMLLLWFFWWSTSNDKPTESRDLKSNFMAAGKFRANSCALVESRSKDTHTFFHVGAAASMFTRHAENTQKSTRKALSPPHQEHVLCSESHHRLQAELRRRLQLSQCQDRTTVATPQEQICGEILKRFTHTRPRD